MPHIHRAALVVGLALVGALTLGAGGSRLDVATPAGLTASAAGDQPAQMIAVNTRGTANNESTDPSRVTYTFPLYSLTTGERLGTGTDDATCVSTTPPPCAVVDDIATFRLPQGDIVSHALLAVAPDPLRPGFILVGARPNADTIVKATGAFAGRTGRVRLSGGDDMRQFPGTLIQDDFWVIELR
jgi:hypothetical protein